MCGKLFCKITLTGLGLILINAFCITSLFAQQADTPLGEV
jgi:hypothetical protein